MNALLQAAADGDLARVRATAESSPGDVMAADEAGFTALHHACGNGSLDVAKYAPLTVAPRRALYTQSFWPRGVPRAANESLFSVIAARLALRGRYILVPG